MLLTTRQSIYDWMRRFEKEGLSGLSEKAGRGRRPALQLSEREAFKNAVLELQKQREGGVINGKDVLALMASKFGIICTQRSVYNHFSAVCPERDIGVGLVLPACNVDAMKLHLEHISAQISEGKHGVVILDRAGWHTPQKIKCFSNLTLIPLPPASPELNPCELIWKYLRQRYLANRCFDGEEQVVEKSCAAWNQFVGTKGLIRSLCSREWAKM
jgi:transposase